MVVWINPDAPDFKATLLGLQRTPGYCAFIDIVGSTAMKDQDFSRWVVDILNTFQNTLGFFIGFANPLKSLGDALMFWIPNRGLSHGFALSMFSRLSMIAGEADPVFKKIKASVAYCEDAYEITFLPGRDDVHGKDIDLTARLLERASEGDVVMNEAFVRRVRSDWESIGNQDQFSEVKSILGPWPERLKGFTKPVRIYKWSPA